MITDEQHQRWKKDLIKLYEVKAENKDLQAKLDRVEETVKKLSYIESTLDCGSPEKARQMIISLIEEIEQTLKGD